MDFVAIFSYTTTEVKVNCRGVQNAKTTAHIPIKFAEQFENGINKIIMHKPGRISWSHTCGTAAMF